MKVYKQLQRLQRSGRIPNGLYYKHTCVILSCIYMQGCLHDGKRRHVWSCNFELQQGHAHHT